MPIPLLTLSCNISLFQHLSSFLIIYSPVFIPQSSLYSPSFSIPSRLRFLQHSRLDYSLSPSSHLRSCHYSYSRRHSVVVLHFLVLTTLFVVLLLSFFNFLVFLVIASRVDYFLVVIHFFFSSSFCRHVFFISRLCYSYFSSPFILCSRCCTSFFRSCSFFSSPLFILTIIIHSHAIVILFVLYFILLIFLSYILLLVIHICSPTLLFFIVAFKLVF